MILCLGVFMPAKAQVAMNRPYVDDKLFHFGFQLGLNFSSFGVTDSELPITNPITGETEIYHARVSSILPGFNVGFITDLRLCNYLNLRFCPGMQFSSRTLSYKTESGNPVVGAPGTGSKVDVLAIPVYLPLYLKWSAAREGNYRPYVIAGGGVSFNVRFCFINNTTLKQKSLFKMALLNNGQPSFLIIKYLGIFARGVFVYHCCCV